VQTALWLCAASAAFPRFLFFLLFGATCTRLSTASAASSRLFFLLLGANCTLLRSASPGLACFLLLGFGATCTRLGASSTAGGCHGNTGARKESGDTKPLESLLQFLDLHCPPPLAMLKIGLKSIPALRESSLFDKMDVPSPYSIPCIRLRKCRYLGQGLHLRVNHFFQAFLLRSIFFCTSPHAFFVRNDSS